MPPPAFRAIIFDFNGVIADDEIAHFLAFQQALKEDGLSLTKEEYYGTYLGMDERNCVRALLRSTRGREDAAREQRIIERKVELFRKYEATSKPPLFPGVVDFVKKAGKRYRLAIASGGRREQILFALHDTPIEKAFSVMVSADDTTVGKPDPQIYQLTLKLLNKQTAEEPAIRPEECLVIEDSIAGIQAALAAGMKVAAIATTYPATQLADAHLVLPCLDMAALDKLESSLRWCL